MVASYESGTSLTSIAREHQLGKGRIRDLLAGAGVGVRRQGLGTEQVAYTARRYDAGLSAREIAAELGVGHAMG